MATKYMEIYSGRRNRLQFPYPSDFNILLSQPNYDITGLNAQDPIYNSFPIVIATYSASSTATNPIITLAPHSDVTNYYLNTIIEDITTSSYRTIISHDGDTRTLTLSSPFPGGGGAVGDTFKIRNDIPPITYTFPANTSTTEVVLSSSSETKGGYYDGCLLNIISSTSGNTRSFRRIVQYWGNDSDTPVGKAYHARLESALPGIPAIGDTYEILTFSKDNCDHLNAIGSVVSANRYSCYEVSLISIILPNVFLNSGSFISPDPSVSNAGSRLVFHPYIYVQLENITSPLTYTRGLYTNNPSGNKALFRIPITDVPTLTTSQFLRLSSNMLQVIKFKPYDNLRLTVFLKEGEIIKFIDSTPDVIQLYPVPPSYPIIPAPPDPTLQITAVFGIRNLKF